MSEYSITVRTEDPTPAERQAAYAELRKKQLPRQFWDPDYYADPKNAFVARSIAIPGPGSEALTEAQFNRLQIAAQGSMIAPSMVDQMIQVMSGSPTISPGTAAAMAQFSQTAQFSSTQLEEVLTLDAEARAADLGTSGRKPDKGSEGEKGGFLSNLAKGVVRPVFALASVPVEAIQGAIRNTVGLLTDPEQQDAYREEHSGIFGQLFDNPFNNAQPTPIEQTTGGQYLAGVYGPGSSDLGSGWIPRGDAEARAVQAMRNAAPLVFNDHWTLGRGVGSMFFDDPNNLAYRNLSGMIDLTAAIVLDPTIWVGIPAAAGGAIRQGQSFAEAVRLGREVAEASVTREAITISQGTSRALAQASRMNIETFDVASGIVREATGAYAATQKSAAASYGTHSIASIRTRVDELNDSLKDAQLDLASARTKSTSERTRARGVEGAEEAADVQSEARSAVDLLSMQLGDDGLDAMMAKVNADSPELPGLFTDSVFVPMKRTDPTPNALPGSDGGADSIIMWRSEKPPNLRSVDDAIDVDELSGLLHSRVRGGTALGARDRVRLEDILTRPGATYADLLETFINAGKGQALLTALRRTPIDGITDVFRLTGGEGGVWWASENATALRWADGQWRVYDGTVGSATERIKSIRAEIRRQKTAERNVLQRRFAEQTLTTNLADNMVSAADLRTSIADSQAAITDAVAFSMGVRRTLGGKPTTSYQALKQWLVGPTREFDAMVEARASELSLAQGLEPVNRAMTAFMTLGASEALRGARRLVEPFATRSRESVFEAMVKMDDTAVNLGRLQRLTSGKIDPTILRGILNAKTEDEVLEVIGPAVGLGISRPITPGVINALPIRLNGMGSGRIDRIFTRGIDWMQRMASITPRFGAHLNFADPQGSAETYRNYMNNVPGLETNFKDKLIGDYLSQTTEVGRGRAVQRGFDKMKDELISFNQERYNFKPEVADLLSDRLGHATRTHEGGRAHVMNWWLKKYANDSNMGFMSMDGRVIPFVGPQLEAELVRGGLILPDTAEITRAIGRWGKAIQTHPALGKSLDLLDSGMDFWRSAILFRFAYTLRNIGEMQFRMFMSGHSSVYGHPLGALAMASAMNKKNTTSRGVFARFATYNKTATGKTLDLPPDDADELMEGAVVEFNELMSRSGSYHDPRSVRAVEQSHDLIPVGVDQPGFTRGWAEKLLDLRQSRLGRMVAGFDPDDIKPLLKQGVNRDDVVTDWLLNAPGSQALRSEYQETGSELAEIWSDPVALRNFLFQGQGSIRERVQEYTLGGGVELTDFLRTGVLTRSGQEVFRMGSPGDRVQRLEAALRPFLPDVPSDTVLNMRVVVPRAERQGVAAGTNRVLDWFFDWNGRKENAWAMGPEFAYAYNDTAVQLMPALDLETRQQIFDFVKGAEGRSFFPSETMMKANAAMKAPPGYLNMDDVERVSARQASEHVKELFYDARQRKQIFHSLRMVMPFAQPFVDTLWHWGRLMAARPYMMEKFGRLGEALTDPGSGVIYDDFDWIDPFTDRETRDPTQGFIYTDPTTGESKFTFPLIGSVLGAALSPVAGFNVAESMTLTAPVQNLNLAFQGDVDYLPGVGPLVSIPLAQLMPDDWFGAFPDWLRSYAFPYGEPDPSSGVFESTFFPSWMRRLTGALYNEDQRAYSYKGVLAYLTSTKEYPGLQSSPAVQQQLIDDAQGGAKILTFIRALGAAILPAAPTQEIYAADADGRLIGSSYLSANWQHLINESGGDYEAATKAFIDSYGMQALSAIVGSSEGDPPISGPGWEFYKNHSEVGAYGEVLGYFFPGDMSLEAYQFQQESGDRTTLTIEERTDKIVQFLYNAEKTQLEGRATREGWDAPQMEEAEELLKARYGGVIPQFTGIDSRTRLDMIRRAITQSEDLANTRGGEGAQLLFEAYDEYTEVSEFQYGSGLSSLKAEPLRTEFLREVDDIVRQFGGQNLAEGSVENIARLFVNAVEPRE